MFNRSPFRPVSLVASLTLALGLGGAIAPTVSAAPAPLTLAAAAAAFDDYEDDGPLWDDSWPAPVATVTVVGTKAVITWEPVGDESAFLGYIVLHEEAYDDVEVHVGQARTATFELLGGMVNNFVVAPVTRAGDITTPAFLTVTAPVSAPTRPDEVWADSSGRSHTIVWDEPFHDGGSQITHYEVTVGTLVRNVGVASTSLTLVAGHQIPHNKVLPIRVVAVNAAGRSVAATSTLVTPPVLLPSAPRNVRAESTADGSNATHTIYWDEPLLQGDLGVARYKVRVGSATHDVPAGWGSYWVQGPAGESVTMTVYAVNDDGQGLPASVRTGTKRVKPAKPSGVHLAYVTGRKPVIRSYWRPAAATGSGSKVRYEVRAQRIVKGKKKGKAVIAKTKRLNQDSLSFRVPRAGTYRVQVRTATQHGKSGWSKAKRVTIFG